MSKTYNSFEIEPERRQFKQLLAVNPNYFGNLPLSKLPSILNMVGNTTYEEIGGVGYNPDLDLLEAVVRIKMSHGYDGGIGAGGSRQFVRFFVNYGIGWRDAGVASFKAHDIPDETDLVHGRSKPLSYAISLEHQPNRGRCSQPVIPKVRAILSWEFMPPADPDWQPVWGNVVERYIQIAPRMRRLIEFQSAEAEAVDPKAVFSDESAFPRNTPANDSAPSPRPVESLAKLYLDKHAGFTVEPHRFAMPDVHAALLASSIGGSEVAEAKCEQYKAIGLDWQAILSASKKKQGDVSYEQLHCVGFDYNREWVVANFTLLRPTGYHGSLCEHGSDEHVAFWIDWDNNGEWTYLATVGVRVHDIAIIPADGLNYWVGVPARLGAHRRSRKEPRIGRLRAVLSWHVRPSETDPNAVPRWGNRLDTDFEIKSGRVLSDLPAIDAIGGVGVANIDVGGDGMTIPNAPFAQTGSPADPWDASRQCAFGGDIYINAEVPASFSIAGYKYRLLVRKADSSGSGEPLMSSFVVTRTLALGGGTVWVSPELGTGWVSYLHPDHNLYSVLGNWQSAYLGLSERNVLWEIKLEMADSALAILVSTGWHRIQLDNQAPVAAIHIDSGGAVPNCNDFSQDSSVSGHFVAYDPNGHFGAWVLETSPNCPLPRDTSAMPVRSSSSPTEFAPGKGWRLDTSCSATGNPLQPCEYVVTVSVWDNTIVHSSQFLHHYAEADAFIYPSANSRQVAEPSSMYAWEALVVADAS